MPTALEALQKCLAKHDQLEERVQAWAFVDRDRVLCEAAAITSGTLNGMVLGIKDIVDVADMPTGCGSVRWKNSVAREDARLVKKLREAGAVILGKTASTAYAFLDPAKTRNPWNAERTPGGSSAGSAAAVASGMCTAAIGTQTGGSVTRPASYCGVASLKPTHGAISTQGVLPLAPTLDHIGIMAKTVRELAILYQALAAPDGTGTQWVGTSDHRQIPDCLAAISSHTGAPMRPISRLGGLFEERAAPELLQHYNQAIRQLESEYAPFDRVVPPSGFQTIHQHHLNLMASEAAMVHQERFARYPDDYPPKITELIQTGLKLPAVELGQAHRHLQTVREECWRMLEQIGVFVTLATLDFAPSRETTGNASFNSPWSFLGFPTVSVPAGWSADGLPFALQFIGWPGSEAIVLAVAAWAESILKFDRRELPV